MYRIPREYASCQPLESSIIREGTDIVTNKIIKYVKTCKITLSLTNALDMRLPSANPDVFVGASVGAGGCYGDKIINNGGQNNMSGVIK
jgi:hypothetical protein